MSTATAMMRSSTKRRFTRVDTKSLVGAVLLGVVFVLVQQIAHRIDAMINPACVVVGGITWATMTALVVLCYRQPAGIITAEVAAFTALATGLSPLALFFVPANGLGSLAYSLVAWRLPMTKWGHHVAAQVLTNAVGNFCVAVGLKVVLNLPVQVILVAAGITTAAGIIGGTIFTRIIYENVLKSGVLK